VGERVLRQMGRWSVGWFGVTIAAGLALVLLRVGRLPQWLGPLFLAWYGLGLLLLAGALLDEVLQIRDRLRRPRPTDLGPEAFEAGWGSVLGGVAYRLHPTIRRLRRAGALLGQLLLTLGALLVLLLFGLYVLIVSGVLQRLS
jgi:hypothetical protein